MIDAIKFTRGAVAKKDYVAELTHFRIAQGRITGFNGMMALSAPINIDLDVRPKADMFAKAGAWSPLGENMTQCQAILKIQHHYKKPLVEKCQQKAITRIDDVPLCGIHLRSIDTGDLQIVTTLKRNPPK